MPRTNDNAFATIVYIIMSSLVSSFPRLQNILNIAASTTTIISSTKA